MFFQTTTTPTTTQNGGSLPGGTTQDLPKSVSGQVLTLTDMQGKPAGRSYDGGDWEPVYPLLFPFSCGQWTCSVNLPPSAAGYQMQGRLSKSLSSDADISRFLTQSTFGPTDSLIASARAMSFEDFIIAQMGESPTLHREYVRERMNQRLRQDTHLYGVRDACEPGSRWNRYAFNRLDFGKTLQTTITASGSVLLTIDGIPRAELPNGESFSVPTGNVLCEISEYVDGPVMIGTDDMCNEASATYLPNPTINFRDTAIFDALLQTPSDAFLEDLSPTVLDTKLLVSLKDPCDLLGADPIFVRAWSNSDFSGSFEYYIGDKRLELIDNSLESTAQKASAFTQLCPTSPKTFLNQDSCKIMPECSAPTYQTTEIQLNDATIRNFYLKDGIYAYRVNGLRLDSWDTPCGGDDSHRWTRRSASLDGAGCPGGETSLPFSIKSALLAGLTATLDDASAGALAIDVPVDTYSCSDPDNSATGASIYVSGRGCWTHSHEDEWTVFDLSRWTMLHNGNYPAFENNHRNPIAKHAERGSVTLNYPSWHEMWRWEDNKWRFETVGNYGATIDFALLEPDVQGPKMAASIGAVQDGWSDPGFEVCGSPGETANVPSAGAQYKTFHSGDQGGVWDSDMDQDHGSGESKQMVWATIALTANDQLRQRIAWALAQIFVVTENDINNELYSEIWANYYDIFVRHAFGDFRSILKEVSLSPMMGEMLTFIGTKSLAYNVEESGSMLFPDENFAREIWQLFTIGLWKLNLDGTQVLDNSGMPIETYSNKDIVSMARGWTGLDKQASRTNYESWSTDRWPVRFLIIPHGPAFY